jgi:four helix bundle protein
MADKITTFRGLKVWQRSHELVLAVYGETKAFPTEEKFGLVSQLRRAAASVATNIVEGHKRKTRKEYLYFLNLADSSLEETKYHLLLSRDLGYLSQSVFEKVSSRCDEVGRMLFGLQKSLRG